MSTDRQRKRADERQVRADAKIADALAKADKKVADALAKADARSTAAMERAEQRRQEALGRAEERAARAMDRAAEAAGPAEPIWARPEPGVRRAGYTREQIARTALAIADGEGFEAVSMRRVASELGAGTMTLYHYVRNKDELMELVYDAMMAEVIVPDDELPSRWRDALAEIARRTRAVWERHAWARDQPPGVTIGPNGMRHFEQSMQAVAGTDLGWLDKVEIINMVDDYVLGYVLGQGEVGLTPEEAKAKWVEPMSRYIDLQLAEGGFPNVRQMVDELGGTRAAIETFVDTIGDPQHFERGLGRLLDGIEKYVESQKPRSGRKKRR
jgi:AcrR family transcriptional regulator